jgi:hypothetical protein
MIVPVLAIWGDSEMVSLGDWVAVPYRGFVERALAGAHPYINVSRHSSHVSQMVPVPATGSSSAFLPTDYRQRWRIVRAAGTTHVFSGFGVNDISSDTVSVVQANLISHWTELTSRGLKAWQYTLPPLVNTSTDLWATLTGQTASTSNSKRVTLNAWIRAGSPIDSTSKAAVAPGTVGALLAGSTGHPLRGYIETSDSWESSRDSGKWKLPERFVTDASAAVGAGITSATAAFTQADVGKTIVAIGAGPAGANLGSTITSIVSGTTVNVLNPPSTATSGSTLYLGTYTGEGQHPSQTGHVAAALDCGPSLLAALAT